MLLICVLHEGRGHGASNRWALFSAACRSADLSLGTLECTLSPSTSLSRSVISRPFTVAQACVKVCGSWAWNGNGHKSLLRRDRHMLFPIFTRPPIRGAYAAFENTRRRCADASHISTTHGPH